MLKLTDFLELAEMHSFKWMRVIDQRGNLVSVVSEATFEAFKEKVKKTAKFFNSIYRVECKKTETTPKEGICIYEVAFGDNITDAQAIGSVKPFDSEAMRKEIEKSLRDELKRESEINHLKDKIKALEAEKNNASGLNGKLEAVMGVLANKFFPSAAAVKPSAALAGTDGEKEYVLTDDDKLEIKQAISLFLKHVTPNELLIIASGVDKNPSVLPMVKQFFGINEAQK